MSHGEFHAHGPHDHQIEHAQKTAHTEPDPMVNRIALFTAIMATLGAVVNYYSSETQIEALTYKNEAVYSAGEASEQVEILQAKDIKKAIAELSLFVVPDDKRPSILTRIAQDEEQQKNLESRIEAYHRESAEWDKKSEEKMHAHERWTFSSAAMQMAVALAAIALISRRRRVEIMMYVSGAVGIAHALQSWWIL